MKKRVLNLAKVVAVMMPAVFMLCTDSATLNYVAFLYLWWLSMRVGEKQRKTMKRWLRMIEE